MPLAVLPCYMYLFAWVALSFLPYVFYSQNLYYVLLIYFSVSAIYYSVYAALMLKLPIYFKFLFLFVFVLSLYGVSLISSGIPIYWQDAAMNVDCDSFLLWLLTSMLSVVPVYVFACKGFIDERIMKFLFFVMFFASIYAFRSSYALQMKLAVMMGNMQEEFTITCIYSLLSILPLVMLFNKQKIIQLFLLCVMFVYFILSAKRGPIILGGICSLLIIWNMISNSSPKQRMVILILSLASLIGIYEFVTYQMETSAYFSLRYDQTLEGYSSRRDEYRRLIWDHIVNFASTKEFFLGKGAHGTLLINDSFAHNDWLAIFLEQGLVGALLFLLYWIGFAYSWIKSKICKEAFVALGLLLIIGLGKTMFSMYYMPISPEMIISSGFFAIALGYYLAKIFPQEEIYKRQFGMVEND